MISDLIDQEPKLLVSDSLKESFPEEIEKNSFNSFITTVLVTTPKSNSLIGNLVGVEFSINPKIDVRVSLYDAFNFIVNVLSDESNKEIRAIVLALGETSTNLMGPYNILNAKIIEIDPVNKMCVLAVDLIKIAA